MNAIKKIYLLVVALVLPFGLVLESKAASYSAPITYRQSMTKIVDETRLQGWPAGYETAGRHIQEIVASKENNILAFTVKLDNYLDKRLYVLGNGGQLVDCTTYLTEAGVNPNNVYGLRMSYNGNRIFFFGKYGEDIYYLVPWFVWKVYPAFKGLAGGDFRWPYSVNHAGTRLFFKHVVNPGSLQAIPGLYYANVGDLTFTPHLMMNMNQLPGPQNANVLRFLGASQEGSSLLCTYFGSAAGNSTAMWRVFTPNGPPSPSQPPVKIPDEDHTWVWGEQDLRNKIVASKLSEGSASALYASQDSGQNEKLYYLQLTTSSTYQNRRLLSGDGGPFLFPTLYDDGAFSRFARFTGPFHKATRVDLLTGEQRDTHSIWFGESNDAYYLTDLVDDSSGTYARFYYMATKPYGQTARIHRVDLAAPPGGNKLAPRISSITFDKPVWAYEDTTPLKIKAWVSDPKGLSNLQYVYMQALVDGLEQPAWLTNGLKPITEAQMFDSGGNGVFNAVSNLSRDSSFYTHYNLPHEVGIRIIAKNKEGHYVIADTVITLTNRGASSFPATSTLLLD